MKKIVFYIWTFLSGLDNIRVLIQNGYTVLRVELEDGAETAFAEYSSFYIAGEADKYRIHVSGYSGTAGKHKIFALVVTLNFSVCHGHQNYANDNGKYKTHTKFYHTEAPPPPL